MSKVLAREIDKTINYYEELKKEINQVEFDEIDFYIYDKMSFLIDQYNKRTCVVEISNIKEYLKFSLELEKDGKSLLIDIQGRFVKNRSDLQTKTYEILSNMINNKAVNIAALQEILK
jgi:RNA processing factor Prp31